MSDLHDASPDANWMRGGLPSGHALAFLSAWSFARRVDTEHGLYKSAPMTAHQLRAPSMGGQT